MPFRAPDGTTQPINNLTIQSFSVPAYASILLWGWANAAWEQAIVIGINGVRNSEQLGTFHRPGFISIGPASHSRILTLAGWHKRSGPDSSQPWHPSRGKTANDLASWDDSGGDNDFNDYLVRIGFLKPVIKLQDLPKIKLIKFDFLPVKGVVDKTMLEWSLNVW